MNTLLFRLGWRPKRLLAAAFNVDVTGLLGCYFGGLTVIAVRQVSKCRKFLLPWDSLYFRNAEMVFIFEVVLQEGRRVARVGGLPEVLVNSRAVNIISEG